MKNRILPYGYCRENGKIILQPQESKILSRIYNGGCCLEKFYDILRKQDDSFKSLWYHYSVLFDIVLQVSNWEKKILSPNCHKECEHGNKTA